MTKFFLAPLFDLNQPTVALVSLLRGEALETGSTLFLNPTGQRFEITAATLVPQIEAADYVLIPQAVTQLTLAVRTYLNQVRRLAQAAGKQVVVFVGGDLSHRVFIDDMIVLKGSQYGRRKRPNEIIVPPLVEDLGAMPRRPKADWAVVGFCGWATPNGFVGWFKYWLKNFFTFQMVFKKGLYFRRRALKALSQSNLVKTNFIVRRSFSGNIKTVSGDPARLRREYVDNIFNSDFILAPKGDGNFSLRFYETLSAGRIPVLIDTDCVLPLEGAINYDEVMVRVAYQNLNQADKIISDWYKKLSPTDWLAKQQAARDLFAAKLRYDQFFNLLLTQPLEDWLQAPLSLER